MAFVNLILFLFAFSIFNVGYVSCRNTKVNKEGMSFHVTDIDQLKNTQIFQVKEKSIYYLRDTIDLKGSIYKMPEGVRIVPKGGIIRNGTLYGNGTIINSQRCMFENIIIKGEWIVPKISTSLFSSLKRENDIKNVFALASSKIHNDIHIKKGHFLVSSESGEPSIKVIDNTNVQIDGVIELMPNALSNYSVLCVQGENIGISGSGAIIGDKDKHLGDNGEWGMGILFSRCRNVSLTGLTVSNCWGDCVYIGGHSCNIKIANCIFSNSRRQGVSITSANGVRISNCSIYNISGTPPGYAIDIEPNSNDSVCNVFVEKVTAQRCKGGLVANSVAKNAKVSSVVFSNCLLRELCGEIGIACLFTTDVTIRKCKIVNNRNCIQITDSHSVLIDNCSIIGIQNAIGIYTYNNKNVNVKNCVIKCERYAFREYISMTLANNKIKCQDLFSSAKVDINEIESNNKIHYCPVKVD